MHLCISKNLKFVQSSKEIFKPNIETSSNIYARFNEGERQILKFVVEAISNCSKERLAILIIKVGTGKVAIIP